MRNVIVIMVGLVVSFFLSLEGRADAVSYDLTNWNDPVLDASTDKVTVNVTTTGSLTTVVFSWVAGNSGLIAIGMDKIGYDSLIGCCALGTTTGWSLFDSDGTPPSHHEAGFGTFGSV